MKSFKQMVQSGEVKRADAMKVQLDNIHEEPGFNVREQDQGFWDGIDQFARYIANGGKFPAIEVRPREDGGVFVVEGHRRRLACIRARDVHGAPIEWVEVTAFNGNDVARMARIATSNSQEPLKPLELAALYRKMRGVGATPSEIAAEVNKTPQHVDQMLVLADANKDVQDAVKRGEVTAGVAVGLVRQHGEGAGAVIADQLGKAKAAGKKKVTAGVVKGPQLPKKETESVVAELGAFIDTISTDERIVLAAIECGRATSGTVMVSGAALLSLLKEFGALTDAQLKQAERQREKANRAAQQELAA